MNNLFLEDFEKYCELWKKEYNSCSFGSTAIFKPYYAFKDANEFDKVLENCKGFLEELTPKLCFEKLNSNGSFDYFLTLRGSVQFEWEFESPNKFESLNNPNLVYFIKVEVFEDKISVGYTHWNDELNGNEKDYQMRYNWEDFDVELNKMEDVCRWIEKSR